jgi:hypothetical protein
MNKNLNFVFFSDTLNPNGINSYGMHGPFFNYILRNGYSYTLNCEIKDGYKNIIMIEPIGTTYGISNIPNVDITKIKSLIKRNDVKLLIVSLADPSNDYSFEICFEYLQKHDMIFDKTIQNTNKIIFIDSNLRYEKIYTLNYFIEDAFYSKNTFYNVKNSLGYVSKQISVDELDRYKTKKFISFNRNTDKMHRLFLLNEYINGNYKDSYFSFLMKISEYADEFNKNNIKEFNNYLPIELDTHDIVDKNSFSVTNTFKKELFLNSCINIVTESSFINNELFLSEKIIKPIVSYQPFIVFGPYGYLEELKKYGFKTFSEFWDESYDTIEPTHDRIDVLIQLVRDLNKLSIDEMNKLYQKTKDICIYNRDLFYSLQIDTLKEILNNIENEW